MRCSLLARYQVSESKLTVLLSSLSARWQGKDIVVGKVTIKAPRYEPDECQIPDPKSLKQQGELEYIQKLIRTELSKMPKNTEGHKGG